MDICIHYWKLGQAYKGIVHARCQKCGAEKDFYPVSHHKLGIHQSKKKIAPSPIVPESEVSD